MASKTNSGTTIDPQQREQYEYARRQIVRKRWLLRHAVLFVIGQIILLLIVPFLNLGDDFLIAHWYRWIAGIWFILFFFHLVNVFVIDRFMGANWEREQMDKMVAKQQDKLEELSEQAAKKNDTL